MSNPNTPLSPHPSCFLFAIPSAPVIIEKGLAPPDSSLQNPTSQSMLLNPGALFLSATEVLISPSDPPISGFSWHLLCFQNFWLLHSPPPESQNTWPTGSPAFQIAIYFLLLLELAGRRKGKVKEQRVMADVNHTWWLCPQSFHVPTRLCPLGSRDDVPYSLLSSNILLHWLPLSFVHSHSLPRSSWLRPLKTTLASTHNEGPSLSP